MTELYEALDDCLDAMARGASVQGALRRYPKLASELRPLLEAAIAAKDAGRVHVPLDVRQRGRAELLKQVAEAHGPAPQRGRRMPLFSRLALTSGLVAALALTSTGLVSASSGALPGQQLYPVKRSWESVQLLFAFSPGQREALESNFEQERLDETTDLLGRHAAAPITFTGVLARQPNGTWTVSRIPIVLSQTAVLPGSGMAEGAPVSVTGLTQADGTVSAQQIQVLQAGASLPPLEPSENNDGSETGDDGGQARATPVPTVVQPANTAGTSAVQPTYKFTGIVESMQGNRWRINGQPVDVGMAQVSGHIAVGTMVRFEGYYGSQGSFVVTTIEPQIGSSSKQDKAPDPSGSGGGSDSGGEPDHGSQDP